MAAKAALQPFSLERREVGPQDVLITITHCGICHSDIHQARDEWGGSIFPMVPGHEIVGTVTQVGSAVKTFKVGERAGVGYFVDSCRTCVACREGSEQYCEAGMLLTYSGRDKDGQPTQGGHNRPILSLCTTITHSQHCIFMPRSRCGWKGEFPLSVPLWSGLLHLWDWDEGKGTGGVRECVQHDGAGISMPRRADAVTESCAARRGARAQAGACLRTPSSGGGAAQT